MVTQTSCSRANMRITPTCVALNDCLLPSNGTTTSALYFKNKNVYQLPNRHIHLTWTPGNVTLYLGHTGTDQICLNSVQGGPINFIPGGWHQDDTPTSGAQHGCHGNTSCLVTGLKILGFMTSLTTYCSIANSSHRCTRSPQGPCDVTHTALTDHS